MIIKELYLKHKKFVNFAFFGVCTTLVNTFSYWILAHPLGISTVPSAVIAWVLAVLFAYITNRNWVFYSEEKTAKGIVKEIISFFSCRLATGILDWICMYIFVDLIQLNDIAIKLLSNILVIVLNFILSKIVVFRKTK